MNIIEQNKEKINGILETFDRIVDFYLKFRFMAKSWNKFEYSTIKCKIKGERQWVYKTLDFYILLIIILNTNKAGFVCYL